jgi:hypothetical protein
VARSESVAEGPTGDSTGNETKGCHGDILKKYVVLSLVMTMVARRRS